MAFAGLLFGSLMACQQNGENAEPENSIAQAVAPEIDLPTAILTENHQALEQHIEAGSDLNAKDPMSGSTPLITAVTFNKEKAARRLMEAGVNLEVQNNDGSSALHSAAFFGRIEMVKLLVEAGANKNLRNNFGATPRESVLGDFEQVKPVYDMMILQLEPLGFQLDLKELEEARPVIAMMLQ